MMIMMRFLKKSLELTLIDERKGWAGWVGIEEDIVTWGLIYDNMNYVRIY